MDLGWLLCKYMGNGFRVGGLPVPKCPLSYFPTPAGGKIPNPDWNPCYTPEGIYGNSPCVPGECSQCDPKPN